MATRRFRMPRLLTSSATVLAVVLGSTVLGPVPVASADGPSPISIAMTPSATRVPSGQQLTYTITVTNPGGEAVDDVVLTDQVNGLEGLVLTSSVGACTQSDNLVTCDAGTVSGNTAWVVTIRGTVTAANGTTLNNTAAVTGTKSSQTFTQSVTTPVFVETPPAGPRPDLRLSITAPSTVTTPNTLVYQLTVNNTGTANATDIRVVNTLPNNVGNPTVTVNATSLFACTYVPGTVTCDGGALNAGANATITITAGTTGAPDGTYDNTAVVDPYDAIAELDELNNTASARTTLSATPPAPGTLLISKVAQTPASPTGQVRPGDTLRYVVTVKNGAATRADSITVTDGTQGLDAASVTATTTKGVCIVNAPTVTCTQKSPTLRLDPNETMVVTIVGRVVASAGSLIINTATVNGNIKNKGQTATSTATTTVRPGKDLTITQRSVCGPSCPGAFRARDQFDYVITVGNSGLDDAHDVVVREPLPAGVILESSTSSDPDVSCAADAAEGGVVTCVNLDVAGVESSGMPGGTIETITLHLTAPNAIGPITSTATVDPNNTIFEADEKNNVVTTTTPILTGIDLTITKDDNFDPVAPSGNLVYTITATNIGTQDVNDVVIRDTLPVGTRFREAHAENPAHDVTCSHDGSATGGVVECVGGDLLGTYNLNGGPIDAPADFVVVKVSVFSPAPPEAIANVVRIDPDNKVPEIIETNNVNRLVTNVAIPPAPGGSNGTYNDLQIGKFHSPPTVVPSGSLTYTLTVKNVGSDAAFNVRVVDHLPAGATFRSAEDTLPGPGAFSCTHAAGVVTCTGGTLDGVANPATALAGDDTRQIVIQVFAPAQPGNYTNQAAVDPGNLIPEANETDNSANDTTKVELGGGGTYRELGITKVQSTPAAAVAPNGVLAYTLTMTNSGTDVAFDTTVTDELPAGMRFRSAQDSTAGAPPGGYSCAADGQVVTCTGGDLDGTADQIPGPATRTITVTAFAPSQPGQYVNQAFVDPANEIAEANETNNGDTATTTVAIGGGGGFIDLKVATSGPATVKPGQALTYTVTVSNAGTDAAFDVRVTDSLPAGTTFVSASDGGPADGRFFCSASGGLVTCSGGALDGSQNQTPEAADTTRTIDVKVVAPMEHGALLVNQAKVDPDNSVPEASEINNTASASTQVLSQVNLTIEKTGPTSATQSSTPKYTLTVENKAVNGAGEVARNVIVRDPLPVGMIPLNVLTPGTSNTFQCEVKENPVNLVECVGDLAPNDPQKIEIEVFITAESGKTLDNVGTIDPVGSVIESAENDNSSAATTVVGDADLMLNKDDLTETVSPGQEQVYTLTVQNIGTATADNVEITDTLPSDVTYVSALGTNGFTCTGTTTVTCTRAGNPSLQPNEGAVVTITTNVSDTASAPISNTASVSTSSTESVTDNNTDEVTTQVGASGIDLVTSEIVDTPDPAPVNSIVAYQYTVTNAGTADANGVVVRSAVPTSGVTFVSGVASEGFNCTNTTGQTECTGNLPAGATTQVTIEVQVTGAASGSLAFSAKADPANAITETDENNNDRNATTTVSTTTCATCVDLVTTLDDTPNSISDAAPGSISYTITVSNAGDTSTDTDGNPATGAVTVVDTLDTTKLTNVTFGATGGFTCTYDAMTGKVTCTGDLDPSQGTTITINADVVGAAVSDGDTIANSVTSDVTVVAPVIKFNAANDNASVNTPVTA